MTPTWQTKDGSIQLYHADCLDVLKELEPCSVDAVVTDPPYGISFSGSNASTLQWNPIIGDTEEPDLRWLLTMDCLVISFGANNYPNQLPHRGRWICWDKRTINGSCDAMLGSAFELAWTNRISGFNKIYRVLHGGCLVDGKPGRRVHPTQKPVGLMTAIISDYTKKVQIVLDPFMGSGTTGVACVRTGRRFIGVEINENYFNIAKERIIKEIEKPGFFKPTFKKEKPPSLFGDKNKRERL